MKVKKFNNLWSMGLIICGALLLIFYVAKLFFPNFIIGIAEVPSIVAFGTFVDSHWWATLIYHLIISFVGGYIYCCACCRQTKLNLNQVVVLLSAILTCVVFQKFCIELYTPYNYVILVLMPFFMLRCVGALNKETFYSTSFCFIVDIMSQSLSMVIRNIVLMTTVVNSATMTILLIDTWIWRILLYLYFNNKKSKEE